MPAHLAHPLHLGPAGGRSGRVCKERRPAPSTAPMRTHLRSLVLGLVAALLLLQPAARAGAGCAASMLTGSCACTEAAAPGSDDEPSCCEKAEQAAQPESAPQDEGAQEDGPRFGAESGCACTASPLPDLPGAPNTADPAGRTIVELLKLAARCTLEPQVLAVPSSEAPPPRAPRPRIAFTVPRASTARALAWFCTWLR